MARSNLPRPLCPFLPSGAAIFWVPVVAGDRSDYPPAGARPQHGIAAGEFPLWGQTQRGKRVQPMRSVSHKAERFTESVIRGMTRL